jgi:hypothetical protein
MALLVQAALRMARVAVSVVKAAFVRTQRSLI